MNTIYFDNAATTKPFDEVRDTVVDIMSNEYYNPSSPYRAAINIDKRLNDARNIILKQLNAKGRIIFTSGGSESNNLAIKGCVTKIKNPTIITSSIEHPSVLSTCKNLAEDLQCELIVLPVDSNGYIVEDELINAVHTHANPFISIMHVNNETGTVQDIAHLSKLAKEHNKNCVFHVDGVQAFMKVPISLSDTMVDTYSLSAHKIHGPKGVGALYIKKNNVLNPITTGGGQENGFRSGTHNTHGICGFSKAVEIYSKNADDIHNNMVDIKRIIIEKLNENDIDYIICGDFVENCAPHVLNIAFKKIKGEVLLSALEQSGVIANTGSACSSKKLKVSSVLSALKVNGNYIEGAIRLSFGAFNTIDEAKICADALVSSVKRLSRFS